MATTPPTDRRSDDSTSDQFDSGAAVAIAHTPTRVSVALVVVTAIVAGGALARFARVGSLVAAGGAGIIAIAGALWMFGWGRWRTPATFLAGGLLVPGVTVVVGVIGYATISRIGRYYPVPQDAAIVANALRIVALVVLLLGVLIALLGSAATVRPLLARRRLKRAVRFQLTVAAVFAGVALGGMGVRIVARTTIPGVGTIGPTLERTLTTAVVPTQTVPAPTGLIVLTALAASLLKRGLERLPIRELVGSRRPDLDARIDAGTARLATAARLAWLATVPAAVIQFVLPASMVWEPLPAPVVAVLITVTTAAWLRWTLVGIVLGVGGLIGLTRLVRWVVQTSSTGLLRRLAPGFVAAAYLSAVVSVSAQGTALLRPLVGRNLPPTYADLYRPLADGVIEYYTPAVVLAVVAAATVCAGAGLLVALYSLTRLRVGPRAMTGPALAGGGLFTAVAFGGAVGAPLGLLCGGLIATVFVWEQGRFATTLGRELGRQARSRRLELLHAAGTLVVGALGAGLAGLIVTETPSVSVPSAAVALLGLALASAAVGVFLIAGRLR